MAALNPLLTMQVVTQSVKLMSIILKTLFRNLKNKNVVLFKFLAIASYIYFRYKRVSFQKTVLYLQFYIYFSFYNFCAFQHLCTLKNNYYYYSNFLFGFQGIMLQYHTLRFTRFKKDQIDEMTTIIGQTILVAAPTTTVRLPPAARARVSSLETPGASPAAVIATRGKSYCHDFSKNVPQNYSYSL